MINEKKILERIKEKNLYFPLDKDSFFKIASDKEVIRIILSHFPKAERKKLIDTVGMSRVERYIYHSYLNYYEKVKYGKGKSFQIGRQIRNNVQMYFPNYVFKSDFYDLMTKLRKKAYHKAFKSIA